MERKKTKKRKAAIHPDEILVLFPPVVIEYLCDPRVEDLFERKAIIGDS
jgi:hypothetical protein